MSGRKTGTPKSFDWRGHVLYASGVAAFLLCMPPGPFSSLVFVALCPWILSLFRKGTRRGICEFWMAGFVVNLIEVHWLRFVTFPGWLALTGYLSLYSLAFAVLILSARRRGYPMVLCVPVFWVALEHIRSFALTGFPWLFLGHALYRWPRAIQIADVTGVYGVSFLVAAWNGLFVDLLLWRMHARPSVRWMIPASGAIVGLVTVFVFAYGGWRLSQTARVSRPGPVVCLAQTNIPQEVKMDESAIPSILRDYERLERKASASTFDLMVWPETMFPIPPTFVFLPELREMFPQYARMADSHLRALLKLSREKHAAILLGAEMDTLENGALVRRNSAFLLDGDQAFDSSLLENRYDKIHLVPFGEYTPLRSWFPFLSRMVPYETGIRAGKVFRVFRYRGWRFGVTICFEDVIPYVSRNLVRGGAEFLVNMSNDGWFRCSSELDQHLACAIFRCVENRVPMARAANTGISSIVTSTGVVQDLLTVKRQRRGVEGLFAGSLALDKRKTFYTTHGDVFARLCLACALAFLSLLLLKRFRKGTHS